MWLERFSGQAPPSTSGSSAPSSRPYSPAPRRSVQLGPSTLPRRPGLTQRTSSLSGAASLIQSTESLPAAARISNGNRLKDELKPATLDEAPAAVKALNALLGISNDKPTAVTATTVLPPFTGDSSDIDFNGLSLEEFVVNTAEGQPRSGPDDVAADENTEVERVNFEELHKSIIGCDEVLKSVEVYLASFKAELASVSGEIETLQNRSTSLNNKLQNRKAVEKVLRPEIEDIALSPAIVRKICESPMDETWPRALDQLERRIKAIDSKAREERQIKAIEDVRPLIAKVSDKAVERIRDYVVSQIRSLRSPNINAQIIQQRSFVHYKDVFAFLAKRQPKLGDEISQAYVNTMRWYYSSHFSRYKAAVEKIKLHPVDQQDAIAIDPAIKRKPGAPYDPFSSGRRLDILRNVDTAAMPSFAAEEDKASHFLEVPFRAFNLALVDNASSEYSFLAEFFSKQSFQATNRRLNDIFQPTFDLGYTLTKQLAEHTLDAVGLLLCVRLNQQLAFEAQRRKVPAAESYINGTNMILWPRFNQIIDVHCESIKKSTAALAGKPVNSALSLTTSSSAASSTAPHSLTQRYANFLQAILALSSDAGDDEPVSNSLLRLRSDFKAFLTKFSKGLAEARKRDRFLFNNYSLICTIIAETDGKLADDTKLHYVEQRDSLAVES